ncbi:hypothetical protein CDAR_178151 [Caerostris darwini]|uniref:Uncharacterized protein n=1 Tax=Caerostris darwini TaxID=1538125 RepID=A0AAV4N3F3_9ARAC|nr:hypothetical protein CDAR_178151 [Caerostris darwini]
MWSRAFPSSVSHSSIHHALFVSTTAPVSRTHSGKGMKKKVFSISIPTCGNDTVKHRFPGLTLFPFSGEPNKGFLFLYIYEATATPPVIQPPTPNDRLQEKSCEKLSLNHGITVNPFC